MNTAESADNAMKTSVRPGRGSAKTHGSSRKGDDADLKCYRCGTKGHKSRACSRKVWCKSNTYQESYAGKRGLKVEPEESQR